jgi:aromatic ring-opening dioxygenase catalytic subunit (LigB family)
MSAPLPRLPSFYLPHGGGPCFFMDDPQGVWTQMGRFLQGLLPTLPMRPRAVVVVSGHWETAGFATTASPKPPLVFDYYGFPPHTYQLRHDAPGDPVLAEAIVQRLRKAGFTAFTDPARGLDHGVFVPMKMINPQADIPIVELSLEHRLDAALHLAVGQALAPLRDEGVLLLGCGMSFHNLRAYGDPRAFAPSKQFDDWLAETAALPGELRAIRLRDWADAPAARLAHPRHEHLLPLMVSAGASTLPGRRLYNECVLGSMISGFAFD